MKNESTFQFERLGFYSLDTDTDIAKGKVIFNRVLAIGAKKIKK